MNADVHEGDTCVESNNDWLATSPASCWPAEH